MKDVSLRSTSWLLNDFVRGSEPEDTLSIEDELVRRGIDLDAVDRDVDLIIIKYLEGAVRK